MRIEMRQCRFRSSYLSCLLYVPSLILLLCFTNAAAQTAIPRVDSTANKPWGFGVAAGIGAMYTSTGSGYFIFATHDHLQLGVRIVGSSADDGDNNAKSFLGIAFGHGPLRYSPAEYVNDRALLVGYRIYGQTPWLALSFGPSYTSGTLRGTNLLSADTTPPGWFNGQEVLLNYNSMKLSSLGFSGQVDMGLKFGAYFGISLSTFYTANKQRSYGGVLFSLVLGLLR